MSLLSLRLLLLDDSVRVIIISILQLFVYFFVDYDVVYFWVFLVATDAAEKRPGETLYDTRLE